MNKREKQTQMLAIGIGTAVVAGLIWFFVISAFRDRLAKTEETILEVEDRIHKAELRIRRARIVEQEFAELRERISAAEAQMIPVEQLNGKKWLLDTVSRFIQTNKHDVVPTRLSNDPLIGKQFILLPKFAYSGAAYDLEVRAYFHEFGRFLADFENSFPYLRIHELQMSPIATPSAAAGPTADVPDEMLNSIEREQLRISMKVVVLFRPEEVL